jgi:hypothetical protein
MEEIFRARNSYRPEKRLSEFRDDLGYPLGLRTEVEELNERMGWSNV